MPDFPQFQSLVNALGWTLIHFLWQGFVIAGLFWLVCKVSSPGSAQLRYRAGLGAYLMSAVAPLGTFWVHLAPAAGGSAGPALGLPTVSVVAGTVPNLGQVLRAGMEPAIPAVVVLWAIGVMILSSRTCLGWLGTRKLVRLDAEPVSEDLRRVAARMMEALGIRHAVRVVRSTRVAVPTVIGWLKPVILMPAGVLAGLPADQLEMIIAHELGHIRRHDYLVNLMQLVIETLFFYHPAVRWMSRQVRQEREHCCDDLVVAQCGRPVLYARALANLEILRTPIPATAMAATGGDLFFRVRRIVGGELPRSSSGFAQLTLMLGVAAMVSISAHQGLELGRELSDKLVVTGSRAMQSGGRYEAAARAAWAEGVKSYADATAEQARIAANLPQPATAEPAGTPARFVPPVTANPAGTQVRAPVVSRAESRPIQVIQAQPAGTDLLLARVEPAPPARAAADESVPDAANGPVIPAVKPLVTVPPKYPFKARSKRLEGFVKLEFSVDARGRVTDIEVVEANPAKVFERAAKKALGKWRFETNAGHREDRRLFQAFDFAMEEFEPDPEPLVRERRCDSTGSKICGMFYNREHVQRYGSQKQREAPSSGN